MKRLTLALAWSPWPPSSPPAQAARRLRPARPPPRRRRPRGDAVVDRRQGHEVLRPGRRSRPASAFAIDFDNQDGAPHNVPISDASGATVFKGEIVTARRSTYAVPALAAGSYPFICEVHPDMKGTITAE